MNTKKLVLIFGIATVAILVVAFALSVKLTGAANGRSVVARVNRITGGTQLVLDLVIDGQWADTADPTIDMAVPRSAQEFNRAIRQGLLDQGLLQPNDNFILVGGAE